MPAGEDLSHILLFCVLALGRCPKGVHVPAPRHGRRVRVLATRVGVHLRVEHHDLDVRAILQHDLGDILEAILLTHFR